MPRTMSSVNAIQISSSCTSSGCALQILERGEPSVLVASGVEVEPVRCPDPPVRLGPELGPGPREREVDVEEHRP